MRPYLSEQLMQGSIVRMMFGTSAKSEPSSAFTMPARFCVVGVRMRMRTPTTQNLAGMVKALEGSDLADVPNIILTIDPCISCSER